MKMTRSEGKAYEDEGISSSGLLNSSSLSYSPCLVAYACEWLHCLIALQGRGQISSLPSLMQGLVARIGK